MRKARNGQEEEEKIKESRGSKKEEQKNLTKMEQMKSPQWDKIKKTR